MKILYEDLIRKHTKKDSAEKEIHHCCIICGKEFDNLKLNRCISCGGALDAIYNLHQFESINSHNPLEKYFSLLPIRNKDNILWFGDGNTPCIHSKNLGKYLGLNNLFLKDETINPTRSTKDRIASVGLSRLKELGINNFCVTSTGNSSTAYARGVQLSDFFKLHIFIGKDFVKRLNYADSPSIFTYILEKDFASTGESAKNFADNNNVFFEGGFFSLARREGLKLAYLEAVEQMEENPHYIFQAVSSGMGLLGAYKGLLEYKMLRRIKTMPKLIGVQQESCSPMANAFNMNSDIIQNNHIVKNPKGIAYAILRGDPTQSYPYISHICQMTGGAITKVSEFEIRLAHNLIYELEGLRVCYASAVAIAGMIKMVRQQQLKPDDQVLVNITGGERAFAQIPTNFAVGYGD